MRANLVGTPAQWREAQYKVATLTPRQRQVTDLIAQGLTSKDAGELLGLSWKTIEIHRRSAVRKLGSRTPAEMARIAIYAALAETLED